ncbi:carboxy terminal-processing peptidase [Algicola sagamiensis]|uniref:carboxy terminal-processing peptidase n=1 Tax=Algicola sagamiensis TaxID=163869 RepID=UPI00039E19B8|nr:carboxy terminal-processing peptidase [Algicola sagamiensis]
MHSIRLKLLSALLCSASISISAQTAVEKDALPKLKQESQHGVSSERVSRHLTRQHYLNVSLDDQLSEKMTERFIKSLDFNKSILLKKDVEQFEKNRHVLDDAVKAGKLHHFYNFFNLSMERRFERYHYAIKLLDKEMDFTKKDEYVYDREDLDWPKDEAELNEIWRQRVKYDALSLKLTGKKWKEIKDILTKRYSNALKRLTQTQSEDAFQVIMNSLARSIEAHTSYLSPRNADRFKMEMNLSLEGIGAVLQIEDDYTTIRRLIPGGPAAQSKRLKEKDRIIAVAQGDEEFVDVIGWRLDDVVDLIKGPKGTTVRLQVLNEGADSHPKVVAMTRETVRLEDRAAKSEIFKPAFGEASSKIGVISFPSFYNNLSKDVLKEVNQLKKDKVDGIIIDLRGNGGGSLQEATLLTGLFIDKGPVVQIRDHSGAISLQRDMDNVIAYDGPLTILVDRYSASASEIFAAAMQDYGRAVVLGEQTFGKGTVQQHRGLGRIYDLYDKPLGSIQFTIAKFYRINGGSTQHRGVIPDIKFPSAVEPAEWGESQEENALPWDSIHRAKYNQVDILADTIHSLRKGHEQRVKLDPEFKIISERIAEYIKTKDDISVSLNEKERIDKKEQEKKKDLEVANKRLKRLGLDPITKLDDAPEILDEIDPFLHEASRITTDLIQTNRIAKK